MNFEFVNMDAKRPTEGYTTDIQPVKSILDQVDEYLNEKHDWREGVKWQSMQIDLDELSDTLFENRNVIQREQQEREQGAEQSAEHPQSHIRPDMIFSPMESPMVVPNQPSSVSCNATPFLGGGTVYSNSNSTSNTPFLGAGSGGLKIKRTSSKNTGSQFSPLTSPALVASDQQQMLNFALPESSLSKKTTATVAKTKRVIKNSPNLTLKRRYSAEYLKNCNNNNNNNNNSPWDDFIFNQNQQNANQQENPSPENGVVPSLSESKATPATLMNYPKVILPSNAPRNGSHEVSQSPHGTSELEETNSNNDSNSSGSNSTEKVWRATQSPVIKPRRSISQPRQQGRNSQVAAGNSVTKGAAAATVADNRSQEGIHHVKNNASRSSSVTLAGNVHDNGSPVEEDEYSKREVHKVAEQGRRNRLNVALAELNSLLPSEMKDSVVIPSKATTVELACTYIKQLLEQTRGNH